MAAKTTLTVNVIDIDGGKATVKVNDIENEASKAKDFVDNWVAEHCDAKVINYSLSTTQTFKYDDDDASDGGFGLVNQRAICLFNVSNDDDEVLGSTRFTMPAPDKGDITEDEQFNSDSAEDLKDALESLTGKKFVYQGGYLEINRPNQLKATTTGV